MKSSSFGGFELALEQSQVINLIHFSPFELKFACEWWKKVLTASLTVKSNAQFRPR